MIIINKQAPGTKSYVVSIGADTFHIYADNEDETIERLVENLDSDWYFSELEVELMAKSVHKTLTEYIADTDLRYCPKHKIYLPKLAIEEVYI